MPNTSASVFRPPEKQPVAPVLIKEVSGDQIDKCVMCDTDTPYKQNTHIDLREHYVEGAGQLCKECWDKTCTQAASKQRSYVVWMILDELLIHYR